MKMTSLVVAGLGALALVLAVVERLFGFQVMGVMPTGLINGATALLLLALVIMAYDRCYCREAGSPPKASS